MSVNLEDVKTKKYYYKTWEQRLAIVKEAKRSHNLSETARKHGTTRQKIKQWEKHIKKIAENCDSMKEFHSYLKKKSCSRGQDRKDKDNQDIIRTV